MTKDELRIKELLYYKKNLEANLKMAEGFYDLDIPPQIIERLNKINKELKVLGYSE